MAIEAHADWSPRLGRWARVKRTGSIAVVTGIKCPASGPMPRRWIVLGGGPFDGQDAFAPEELEAPSWETRSSPPGGR